VTSRLAARRRLRELGQERAQLRDDQARVRDELGTAILEGRAAGVSVSDMGRLAGLSRQSVHEILREGASAPVGQGPS
jgi:hypothetical protein